MSKKEQSKGRGAGLILLILLVAVCIAAVIVRPSLPQETPARPAQTTAAAQTTPIRTEPIQTVPIAAETQPPINLGYGLQITDSGSYTGLYMEDGSNEIVSDVMMVVVENTGEEDIQLAEFTAVSGGEEYRFKLTNLAAGERAVLLEQERRASSGAALDSAVAGNVALFPESMELYEDTIEIGGLEGMLNVQNISSSDISGDICIYYKYAAQDIYYGGITFRVRIEGGLKAGELRQIPAGHFDPDGCAVVQVTIYE